MYYSIVKILFIFVFSITLWVFFEFMLYRKSERRDEKTSDNYKSLDGD